MKKFEIVKTTAEISWKERNEIKEGCTMYDVDPEKIASFGTKEEAEKELKKIQNGCLRIRKPLHGRRVFDPGKRI